MTALQNRLIPVLLITLAAGLSGCAPPGPPSSSPPPAQGDPQPSVAAAAAGYKHFQRLTKDSVFVNPEFALLCVGVSKEGVDAARSRTGPHTNTSILIYMNDPAADAFRTRAAAFPVGSVIVKQKDSLGYRDQGKWVAGAAATGVGGMIKRPPGYDPKHGDWEYFYFEDPAKIESGRISSCVQCHTSAKDRDYVFGSWNKPAF